MKKNIHEVLYVSVPKVLGGFGTILLNIALMDFMETPQMYALYTFCVTMILLIEGVLGSAFDQSVLRMGPVWRESDYPRSICLEKCAIILKFWVLTAAGVLIISTSGLLNDLFLKQEGATWALIVMALASIALLMFRSTLLHHQIDHRFKTYGGLDMAHHSIKFALIFILLFAVNNHPATLLFPFFVAPLLLLVFTIPNLMKKMTAESRGVPTGEVYQELIGHGKWFLVTFGVTALVAKLDILLYPVFAGMNDEMGFYNGAATFALIPEMLGIYLSIVLAPRIMPRFKARVFKPFFAKIQIGMIILAIFGFLIAWLGQGLIIKYILPDSFAPTMKILLILLPGALGTMICFPMTYSFIMFIKPRFLVTMELAFLIFLVIAYYWSMPKYGAVGAAWVTSGFKLVKSIIAQIAAWHWSGTDPSGYNLEPDPTPEIVAAESSLAD